jgi:hypothetical protein
VPAATTVAERLAREAKSLEIYTRRTERLFASRYVPRIDLDRAYAAAYMLFYVLLEDAVEELFVGLLTCKLTVGRSGVRPIVPAPNKPVARRLILGGRKYVDWFPFDRHTRPRAEALFVDGKPFTDLAKADSRFLGRMAVLRNALSHRSGHSVQQFEREFITRNPVPGGVPPDQRRPAGYLRGQHATTQSRLDYQMAEGAAIVRPHGRRRAGPATRNASATSSAFLAGVRRSVELRASRFRPHQPRSSEVDWRPKRRNARETMYVERLFLGALRCRSRHSSNLRRANSFRVHSASGAAAVNGVSRAFVGREELIAVYTVVATVLYDRKMLEPHLDEPTSHRSWQVA